MDIHNYEKRYQQTIQQVKESSISEGNKKFILDFISDMIIEGVSKPRLIKYGNVLKLIAISLQKDFNKAELTDIKQLVSTIQQRNDYSPWTKQSYKIIIRKFYKWLSGTKEYPPIVNWITIRINKTERPLPAEGDLLSEEDIKKLLAAANHPRDKALIAMLWESGTRIGEIGNLKVRNISFDDHGALLTVRGKTGSRKVRLIFSIQYLCSWLAMHPCKDQEDASLWLNIGTRNQNKPMEYATIRMELIRLFKKAGIRKRCNPHLFRHSRATFMAHHLTEFQMNQYFGWIQGSKMPSTYVHMSGRDVDNAILRMNGMSEGIKKEESKLLPIRCPRCDMMNSNENKFCCKCGGILDLKYAMELQEKENMRSNADQLMNMLMRDKDVQDLLREKLAVLKI